MYDFLLQIIVFLSLGFIVYLFARALPRVSDETLVASAGKAGVLDRLLKKLPLAKMDLAINAFWGKALRRFKIVVLKIDNLLNRYISKVKKSDSNRDNNPPIQ